MRRDEFEVADLKEAEQFLQEMTFGFLGTVREDGYPAVTPLNFVYTNGAVYFHGSRVGEKMSSIGADGRVSFSVAKEYALIPSYFSDPLMACPATAYFKSVLITGKAAVVDDPHEKASALEALMRKLQPEGGCKAIDAGDPDYAPRLKGVAVVKIGIESMSAKFKFGQNLKGERLAAVMDGLSERGLPDDEETRALMMKYCPHAKRLRTEGIGE
ncbi:MAG TPA: pyridoxamine 5'-phosphate oxidase family protein [Paenibacillus sp.]|uniref:pyridoxamine 5'-phosphate oxidase family protein n=1 Tax=Paenibacillus sp. TaxID=58172 RepID=UPI002CB01281|nr:pyridoxamine 5'-phosphate oxidase family protein [Paenibacillus sp.]HUC91628.1 pyridoxamine 5'-phosphate oxidase family protein [Paenibacillus sp.]